MADQPLTLSVPGSAELHLRTRSGNVSVIGEERSDVLVESGAPARDKIEIDATGRIEISSAKGGSAALSVRCPVGSPGRPASSLEGYLRFGASRARRRDVRDRRPARVGARRRFDRHRKLGQALVKLVVRD